MTQFFENLYRSAHLFLALSQKVVTLCLKVSTRSEASIARTKSLTATAGWLYGSYAYRAVSCSYADVSSCQQFGLCHAPFIDDFVNELKKWRICHEVSQT